MSKITVAALNGFFKLNPSRIAYPRTHKSKAQQYTKLPAFRHLGLALFLRIVINLFPLIILKTTCDKTCWMLTGTLFVMD